MNHFIMWLYGVTAEQAAARAPVMWFTLIVTVAALLLWGLEAMRREYRMQCRIARLENRVNRYRGECEQLESRMDAARKGSVR